MNNDKIYASHLDLLKESEAAIALYEEIMNDFHDFYIRSLKDLLTALDGADSATDNETKGEIAVKNVKNAFIESIDELHDFGDKHIEKFADFVKDHIGDAFQVGFAEGVSSANESCVQYLEVAVENGMIEDTNGGVKTLTKLIAGMNKKYTDEAFKGRNLTVSFPDEDDNEGGKDVEED